MWKGQRKVITGDTETRCNIIKNHHDLPAYGHPGISRTTDLVAQLGNRSPELCQGMRRMPTPQN
jgi:hypothetical protein